MNQLGALEEDAAWTTIGAAKDQVREYNDWCRIVLAAQSAGSITISDAIGFITPRRDMSAFSQLERNADVQIVMDYASDIYSGAAYIDDTVSLERDWKKIVEIIQRH